MGGCCAAANVEWGETLADWVGARHSRHHAAAVGSLPLHHRDPFDHLLIAQALIEQLTLVSRDRQFAAYGVKLRW
jgi:PIN domain nuclease of toxin-antitoxin system